MIEDQDHDASTFRTPQAVTPGYKLALYRFESTVRLILVDDPLSFGTTIDDHLVRGNAHDFEDKSTGGEVGL